VLSWTDVKPTMQGFFAEFGRALTPLWPVRGTVEWPPELVCGRKGLDALADIFGPA
jgi:hypothetical protein